MYIIVVNPGILSQAGVPFPAALTATVIVSFLGSCAMGLYARNPVLVVPGMGMNALFAFVMVHAGKMPWQTALSCVFWAGVIFFAVSLSSTRASSWSMRFPPICGTWCRAASGCSSA
ncbi:Xanthine/uracil/thiamine/ascorbate permease family protein [Candidatus Burkholderia brachyanthoides]|nr:Xanthine/uracil/thiamine/ascorbate permease family protein [Candidatus Burkholderia brachyanthoides]